MLHEIYQVMLRIFMQMQSRLVQKQEVRRSGILLDGHKPSPGEIEMKKLLAGLLIVCFLTSLYTPGLAESSADVLNGLSNFINSLANLAEATKDLDSTPEPAAKEKLSGPTVEVKVAGKTLKVHQEFKEQIDQYEAFFDQYIEALSKDDIDLIQYANLMTQYIATLEAFENIDEEVLSDDDNIYYLDVLNRVNLKLLMTES